MRARSYADPTRARNSMGAKSTNVGIWAQAGKAIRARGGTPGTATKPGSCGEKAREGGFTRPPEAPPFPRQRGDH